jgi:hypothetical protein
VASTCPSCGTVVLVPEISFRDPFKCPSCAQLLCVHQSYFWAQFGAASVTSALGSYLVGFRELALLGAAVLVLIPASFMIAVIGLLFFPPRLYISKEDGPWTMLKLRW